MSLPVPAAMTPRGTLVPAHRLAPRCTMPSPPATTMRSTAPEARAARPCSMALRESAALRSRMSAPAARSRVSASEPMRAPVFLPDVGLTISPRRPGMARGYRSPVVVVRPSSASERGGLGVVDVEPVGASGGLALVEDPADEVGGEVERDERRGEDEHRERVRRGRRDGGEDEDEDDRDAPPADEPGGRHRPDDVEGDEHHGEEEPEPEDEDEASDEREVHRHLLDVRRALGTEAVEDRQGLREDGVAQPAAEQEERHDRADEGQGDALLLAGQPGDDEG